MDRLPFRNSFDYIRASTFFDALSPQSKSAILEIILQDDFSGATDPQTLGLLYAMLAGNSFSSVLQLGTWMGFSTIVLADALLRSTVVHQRKIIFDTVELDKSIHKRARSFIEKAGFSSLVRCIDGSTLDGEVLKTLHVEYDFIYVDSSHATEETRSEIELYFPRLRKEGVMVFHDSSHYASRWDPTNRGGVRKALDEWIASPGGPKEYFFFEKPFWASECGLFVVRKS